MFLQSMGRKMYRMKKLGFDLYRLQIASMGLRASALHQPFEL